MRIKTIALLMSLLVLPIYKVMGQKMNTKTSCNIPSLLREKTLVAFTGTFYAGRTPCQTYAEENRRWRLIKGFKIDDDLLGNIEIKEIEIDPQNDSIETDLIEGARYCILLSPDTEKLKYITDNEIPFDYSRHLISNVEIITITKIE